MTIVDEFAVFNRPMPPDVLPTGVILFLEFHPIHIHPFLGILRLRAPPTLQVMPDEQVFESGRWVNAKTKAMNGS